MARLDRIGRHLGERVPDEDGRPFQPALEAMPKPTESPWSIVPSENGSTISRQNIWRKRRSPEGCFSFWWAVRRRRCGMSAPIHHIERKKPMPYVNHYSFHILDPEWGHITIKISGHPRFPAQVILNGHEHVACQARKAGISFTKEDRYFTHISDAAGLARIADTLFGQGTIGRLSQACERWIYTTCLCFALDLEEQKQSGFHCQYSNYQVE